MKSSERQQQMTAMIPYNGYIMVKDLSEKFGVTEETVRRDLQRICDSNPSIKKVHGGVYRITSDDHEAPQTFRKVLLTNEKSRFADYCTSLPISGCSVMVDSSTTSLFFARLVLEKKIPLMIITNSLQTALLFQNDENVNVVIVGGKLRKSNGSLVGMSTLEMLDRFCADYAFISPTGVDMKFGLTDNSEREAQVRERMIRNSKKRILLADHTKFGLTSPNRISPLDSIDCVVTDKLTSPEWVEEIRNKGIEIIIC